LGREPRSTCSAVDPWGDPRTFYRLAASLPLSENVLQ
jgi:hypothetical protein